MKNRKGFTIVELVIVIAVIAILAAVLIPTFSGVVNKANQSARQQEMTNALKVVLAGNAEQGALAKDTVFVLSDKQSDNSYKAVYYAVYNGNKLGEIFAVNGNKDSTNNLQVTATEGEATTSLFRTVIVGYDKDKTTGVAYDEGALQAIAALFGGTYDSANLNSSLKTFTVGTITLNVISNSDLSEGTFALYK